MHVRIAVTGASGVLGRGLAARLLSQGHDVAGIARHRPESWPSAADFVAADIRDAAAVRRAVAGADVVAHCAWATSPGYDSQISHLVNIGGTRNVLDAMAETGSGRIVFASSAHVYGAGDAPKTERDAPESDLRRRRAQGPGRTDARGLGCRMGRDSLRADPRQKRRQLGAPAAGISRRSRGGRASAASRSSTSTTRFGYSTARSWKPKSPAVQ